MKVCALGEYFICGEEPGFHWDGQARAFEALDYNTLFLDLRRTPLQINKGRILEFQPDILWIGLKEGLLLLQDKDFYATLKNIGTKVVYWFCDLRGIETLNNYLPLKAPLIDTNLIKNKINYMFITNTGQLKDYQYAYGCDNIYYMPQACTPQFHYRRTNIKETADMAFAGGLDTSMFHLQRTELLLKLKNKYNLIFQSNSKAGIPEFYSSAKLAFGSSYMDGPPETRPAYSVSNRFWIALGCGTCLVHQYYEGIDTIVRDGKHAVIFKTEQEMFDKVEYYLTHEDEREQVKINAQHLAHLKHSYVNRIQNMMEIINGHATSFNGFLS